MIIFVGVAGAGKSIQGRMLAKDLDCPYFSTGEFLRSHVDKNIQNKMLTGELVSDEETISVLDDALDLHHNQGEFILDGFPRTASQAEWLIRESKEGRFKVTALIHLLASPEVIVPRLLGRHRPDDHPEAIKKRLDEYRRHIEPIVSKFKQSHVRVIEVNAEASVEVVNKKILSALKETV
ncbi:MAG TPA: nucleoside monophosphate kinase [Candidatus Saccharimonadales bacterium]|nr:nucleoside monophosphate kinase [Candidatus Saccharimonadales bacterium]